MVEKSRAPLAAMRRHHSPNLVILSRAADPPIARLRRDDEVEAAKEKAPGDVEASTKGTKRELRGMSVKSSLAVARVLSSLDWAKNGQCIHVSATYWKTWPSSKQALSAAKAHIVAMLGRHCEAGIWRLEYQRRETVAEKIARLAARVKRVEGTGNLRVPHWHFLLWLGDRSLEEVSKWLYAWWAEYADNPSPRALVITSGDQARGTWYLAMHAAKREQSPPFAVGRWWGYINREKLLAAQDMHDEGAMAERERVWWARLYRRSTGCKTRNAQGISWFLPRAEQRRVVTWAQQRVEDELLERNIPKNPF